MSKRNQTLQQEQVDRGHAFENEVRGILVETFKKTTEGNRGNLLVPIPDEKSAFFENLEAKIFKNQQGLNIQLEIDAVFYVEKAEKSYTFFETTFSIKNNSIVAFEITCSRDSLDKYTKKCVQIGIITQVLLNYPEAVFEKVRKNDVKQIYFFLIVEKKVDIERCFKKCLNEYVSKKVKQTLNLLSVPLMINSHVNKVVLLGTIPQKNQLKKKKEVFVAGKNCEKVLTEKFCQNRGNMKENYYDIKLDFFEPKIVIKKKDKKKKKVPPKIEDTENKESEVSDELIFPQLSDKFKSRFFRQSSDKMSDGDSENLLTPPLKLTKKSSEKIVIKETQRPLIKIPGLSNKINQKPIEKSKKKVINEKTGYASFINMFFVIPYLKKLKIIPCFNPLAIISAQNEIKNKGKCTYETII